jgi:hypothetical protein
MRKQLLGMAEALSTMSRSSQGKAQPVSGPRPVKAVAA